jgi:polysaccharide biosynthesis protein PslH
MRDSRPVRVLWVATKLPVPATEGGRLLVRETLAALSRVGVGGVLLASAPEPVTAVLHGWRIVGVRAPSRWSRLARLGGRGGAAIARHAAPALARMVGRVLDDEPVHLVQAEQIQALPQCAPAVARGIPVVLRAQNVERDVFAARVRWPGLRALAALEARRLAAFEVAAIRGAALTIALTDADAGRLGALGGPAARVRVVRPPFPPELPPGPPLAGAPAVVLFGSAAWFPNRRGAAWFVSHAWPVVRARLPGARLHVIGIPAPRGPWTGTVAHPAPLASRAAFAEGAILAVPSRVTTGIRMKVLEAWARGVVVVATPEAATGLDLADDPIALATTPEGFAAAIAGLHEDRGHADRQRAAARRTLRRRHDPVTIGAELRALYAAVSGVTPRPAVDPPARGRAVP